MLEKSNTDLKCKLVGERSDRESTIGRSLAFDDACRPALVSKSSR